MTDMMYLKKCPFCGGTAGVYSFDTYNDIELFKVKCDVCGAEVCKGNSRRAVNAWNLRTERKDDED